MTKPYDKISTLWFDNKECVTSYGGGRPGTGRIMTALVWAARRARWYAERRAARNARTAVERDRKVARR